MEEQNLACDILLMFILLFRVHLKDIFNPVFASHRYCKPLSSACLWYETYSSPGCLAANIFLQAVGALSSRKALEHRESTYNNPTGQLLNSEPVPLLPNFKAQRDRARRTDTQFSDISFRTVPQTIKCDLNDFGADCNVWCGLVMGLSWFS